MKEVFKKPGYIILSFVVFLVVLAFAIWLPNLTFIHHTAVSPSFNLNQKIGILGSSLLAINTNFSPLSRFLTITVSLLFSLNISMMIYYLKKRIAVQKSAGMSFLGIALGLVGVGCASCGSVILTSFLGLSAATSFLGKLPLKGNEFGILSMAILIYSLFVLSAKLGDPMVCNTAPEP